MKLNKKIIELNIDMILLQRVKTIEQVFYRVVGYIWPSTKFSYSDANGASGGIAMMWNLDWVVGVDIFVSTHLFVINFTT